MADVPGGPRPDLYQVLGVPRGASREQIAQAWRRRARAEHPDAHPRDAAAPARFRALAQAWQVLGDPARRAAYDRALGPEPGLGAGPQQHRGGVQVTVTPLAAAPDPPLRAGPVRVEGGPGPVRPDPRAAAERAWLAIWADLAIRSLARDGDWPW